MREETTGRLIATPDEVVTKITQMETAALSPDPTLPPGAPFPWTRYVSPTSTSSMPIIFGCITPAIMQETIRMNPSHKAAGPDGVPCFILKHMSLEIHEALYFLFQPMAIT